MDTPDGGKVMAVSNLTEFFRDALAEALAHQKVALDAHSAHYVVNLLTLFSRAENSHAELKPGCRWISLADLLAQAQSAQSPAEQAAALQRLGDVSLFMAGFCAHGFSRRLVDVDYPIAMGGRAYGTLAGQLTRGPRRALGEVFAELARKFQPVVDALGEVADSARNWSQHDVLRLYEIWLKTGSTRAHALLRQLGVQPHTVPLHTH
jgi:hypothetical protein